MRGVTESSFYSKSSSSFLLTRLMRGVTTPSGMLICVNAISTHTPHARRDKRKTRCFPRPKGFLLTRLMRGVTYTGACLRADKVISTHTPHARRDSPKLNYLALCAKISTHTPHARRDTGRKHVQNHVIIFLLTRLMRGVTS